MAIWAEIKKAINSNISEPLNEFFERKIDNKSSVKSVQYGRVPYATGIDGYITGFVMSYPGSGSYTYTQYQDITIGEVSNINKCLVVITTYGLGGSSSNNHTPSYPAELVNSTTLRVYVESSDNTTGHFKKNLAGYIWQVIEFE